MAGPNQDQFESFFRRADLDGDGRISGAEAVAFFQGSNLPKQVLAQIWMHADHNHTSYLGRQEFYNALKLVTVAQSKRELTPDIVKAALYGPAATKIPPPQINLSATPAQQINSTAAVSVPQMSVPTQMAPQNFGFRGPGAPNVSQVQQQSIRPYQAAPHPTQGSVGPDFSRGGSVMGQTQVMPGSTAPRPPQTMPAGTAPRPPQSMPASTSPHPPQSMPESTAGLNVPNSNISSDWLSGGAGGASTGSRAISPSTPLMPTNPQTPVSSSSQLINNKSKALVPSGNGFASDSVFGGDVFSAITTSPKQGPSSSAYSASTSPTSSANVPVSGAAQPSSKPYPLNSLQSAFSMQPAGSQIPQNQLSLNPGQKISSQSSSFASAGISVGSGNSTPDNSQVPWPKMKPSDIQKYSKVFMEVDTDRDGRITGEQARNLFMSWRLPREVLKQVWDLSDQDSDSMLSLREFCFALYLMERYREGRPLPAVLPRNVMFDETLLSMTSQPPNAGYGNAAWGPGPGFGPQQVMRPQAMTPAGALRPPNLPTHPTADGARMLNQQKPRAPVLDDNLANQLDNGEYSADSKLQDSTTAGKKVDEREKVILDSREKIEFYRSKMQELVLYKSRCDNRLNEITERALADRREAETLGKKYEEKYKQVAEIASKLTIEDAKFRELQERKMELHQAIVNMERGGSADGLLQVRADRIQSDLEELLKALTERCKKHGIDVKSHAVIELPFGWQPGIQEGAGVWDEDWDKFEDAGFGNEITFDVKNASASPNTNSSVQMENTSPDGSPSADNFANVDERQRELMNAGERAFESESAYTHSEDESARSPHDSPAGKAAPESPSQNFSDVFRSSEADAETHRSFDDSTWGAFDNDDTDSVWGFNTKGSNSDKNRDFFGSSNFGGSPIRTESPTADSTFHKKSPFRFDDSVPSTPLSRFGNSPPRHSEASSDHFDSFSRFDSFNVHDSGFSSHPERLTRFDSMNSTNDFGPFSSQPEKVSRFDSMNSSKDFGPFSSQLEKFSRFDSMSSTSDFGHFSSQTEKFSRFDSMNSARDFGGDKLSRFDSMSSTKDVGNSPGFYSFDDTDPFGSSGPFKVSTDSKEKSSLESSSKDKF